MNTDIPVGRYVGIVHIPHSSVHGLFVDAFVFVYRLSDTPNDKPM